MNVFFDVQGTLISGGRPRPHARAVFSKLAEMDHDLYVWSSGGAAYAERAARTADVLDLILGCYGKSGPVPVSVDFVVDDQPGFAARYGNGYTVPSFDGDPEDDELWNVFEALTRTGV